MNVHKIALACLLALSGMSAMAIQPDNQVTPMTVNSDTREGFERRAEPVSRCDGFRARLAASPPHEGNGSDGFCGHPVLRSRAGLPTPAPRRGLRAGR